MPFGKFIYNSPHISTSLAIAELTHVSLTYKGELDFIVCSHESSGRVIKIANGKAFEGADVYWIGNAQAAKELSKMSVPQKDLHDLPDYISTEGLVFKAAFLDYMENNQCEGIGGVVIDCICSPFGHCYNTHAGFFSWDTIILG